MEEDRAHVASRSRGCGSSTAFRPFMSIASINRPGRACLDTQSFLLGLVLLVTSLC